MHSFDLLYGELERLQIEAVTVFVRLGLLKRKLRDDSAGTVAQKDEDSAAKVDALHLLVEIDVWRDGVEQAGGYLVRLVENEQRRVALIDRIVVFVFYLSLFLFMFFPIICYFVSFDASSFSSKAPRRHTITQPHKSSSRGNTTFYT